MDLLVKPCGHWLQGMEVHGSTIVLHQLSSPKFMNRSDFLMYSIDADVKVPFIGRGNSHILKCNGTVHRGPADGTKSKSVVATSLQSLRPSCQ